MSLDQIKSTSEILDLYERRGDRIPETKEFENLGIEDGAVFHEKLQAAGKKFSAEGLKLMEDKVQRIPYGAEVIDSSIPLVLLAVLNSQYDTDSSKYYHRVDFELIKPPQESIGQMTNPQYLIENCSSWTKSLYEKEPVGERVSEMAFSKWEDNTWYQHHRKTNSKYSRQNDASGVRVSLGREMLAASEEIPAIQAKKEGVTQTSLLDPAQVGVMLWAVRNGYEPATPEDAQLWKRVQVGDPAFYIQDYLEDGQSNPDYVYWKNPKEGSDEWKEGDTWKPMVRIKFEKKFYPKELKNSWDTASDVSDAIGEVISS